MERAKNVIEIGEKNMMATLGAGATLFELMEELDKHNGITFPAHLGDKGAPVGGMVTTNAGGRYGIMRNRIKATVAVFPN